MLSRLLPPEILKKYPAAEHIFCGTAFKTWYDRSVGILSAVGIVKDGESSEFEPDQPITHAEFACMAARFFETAAETDLKTNYKIPIFNNFYIINEKCLRRSNDPLLRGEAVTIINRLLNRRADREYIDEHADKLKTFADVSPTSAIWYDILEAANMHKCVIGEKELWSR